MKLKLVKAGPRALKSTSATRPSAVNSTSRWSTRWLTAYAAAGRAGTKAQLTKAEVRGGGKKPWRQKGTGQARAARSAARSGSAAAWVFRGQAAQPRAEGQPQDVSRRDLLDAVRTRAPGAPARDVRARARGAEDEDAGGKARRARSRAGADPDRGLRREAGPRVAQPEGVDVLLGRQPRPGLARALPEGARDRRRAAHARREAPHDHQDAGQGPLVDHRDRSARVGEERAHRACRATSTCSVCARMRPSRRSAPPSS